MPHVSVAVSMKHTVRTLAQLAAEIVPWFKEHFSADFEAMKSDMLSTFSMLWVDHTCDHIEDWAEALTMLMLEDPSQENLETVVFDCMFEIVGKWISRELSSKVR